MGGGWLRSARPILVLPRNIKDLPADRKPGLGQTPPKVVSSHDLPQRLRTIAHKALVRKAHFKANPLDDPTLAQNGTWKPNAEIKDDVIDAEGNLHVDIPNPFIPYPYPVEDFHPFQRSRIMKRIKRLITPRDQLLYMARHPSWCLPPSPLNPIQTVPPIKWEGQPYNGAILHWVGAWTPKVKKGIYANRAKIFKGKRREREAEIKQEELAERIAGMDERISRWREQRLQAKRAAQPQIPF